MATDFDRGMLVVAGLLALSVLASKFSAKIGIPATLVFLVVGMLAGSDGPGGIWYDNVKFAQHLGVIGLAFILFSGGMETNIKLVRRHLMPAVTLSSIGVIVTAGLVGWAAHLWLGLSLFEGLLLGAIIAPTDAAAVFATLKGRKVKLPERVETVVELESGLNDPAAIFLTLGIIEAIKSGLGLEWKLVGSFVTQMGIGTACGLIFGWAGSTFMRRVRLDFEALYSVVTVCLVLASFSATAIIGGSGFLAVFIAGLVFGNGDFRTRRSLAKFSDGIAWLMQIAMFLLLGLLVFPSQLPSVAWAGLTIVVLLTFVARPLGVLVSLLPWRVSLKEQSLIAWCGLRGAVPIVLATFPLLAGTPRAQLIFDIVFFVVLVSTLLQGMTIRPLSERLFPKPAD